MVMSSPYFMHRGSDQSLQNGRLEKSCPSTETGQLWKLRSTQEIPVSYRSVFEGIPYFNVVQSTVLDDVLYSDKSVVVCAPTGSGKTMIFELAIVRMLIKSDEFSTPHNRDKVVYMAPLKALCSQRHQEWQTKFQAVGLTCIQLTGDSNFDDFQELQNANIILTTPEKWDSTTRKWNNNAALISQIKLFLIDEVHLLGDDSRGATMEAVVSRMKTKHAYLTLKGGSTFGNTGTLRFIAVSATIPNVSDIANWLSTDDSQAAYYSIGAEFRPVKLKVVVLAYPCYSSSEFKFDMSLNYKLKSVIDTYSEQKPTLVFCATRKSAEQAATRLADNSRFIENSMHRRLLDQISQLIKCSKLRQCLTAGIGYHHAGLDLADRQLVEKGFISGHILVLMSTSTLAIGVNLPAHLVIVKSTSHYVKGVCEEYTQTEIMQMVGRAGRPQFDTSATSVIMTKMQNQERYQSLVTGTKKIESSLHKHMIEHLNAEIVLGTIPDVSFTLQWLRSTFLYIRALKNPTQYGYPKNLAAAELEENLHKLCSSRLDALASEGLVVLKESYSPNVLQPTMAGCLMAQYCIKFETMKDFARLSDVVEIDELINFVANSEELKDVTLRVSEKSVLNQLNKSKSSMTIRYPMEGKIKTSQMKVNCLLQAVLSNLTLQDFTLQQDVTKIFRAALRISRCLIEYQFQRGNFLSLLKSIKFAQCIKARMWENSPYVCRQLPGIGPVLAAALAKSGVKSFDDASEKNPRDIELFVNRHPPFGNHILDAIRYLPKYSVNLVEIRKCYNSKTFRVTVAIRNALDLEKRKTIGGKHVCVLLIGDSCNNAILKHKLTDSLLVKSQWSSTFEVKNLSRDLQLQVALCSQEWVGLDVEFTWPTHSNSAGANFELVEPLKPGCNSNQELQYSGAPMYPFHPTEHSNSLETGRGTAKSRSTQRYVACKEFSPNLGKVDFSYSACNASNRLSQFAFQKSTRVAGDTCQHLSSDHIGMASNKQENDDADFAISEFLDLQKSYDKYQQDFPVASSKLERMNKRKCNVLEKGSPAKKRFNCRAYKPQPDQRCYPEPQPIPDFDLLAHGDHWITNSKQTSIEARVEEGREVFVEKDGSNNLSGIDLLQELPSIQTSLSKMQCNTGLVYDDMSTAKFNCQTNMFRDKLQCKAMDLDGDHSKTTSEETGSERMSGGNSTFHENFINELERSSHAMRNSAVYQEQTKVKSRGGRDLSNAQEMYFGILDSFSL